MGRRKSGRTLVAVLIVLLLCLITHDTLSAPADSFSGRAAIVAIDQYRAFISPRLRGVVSCRFKPTCSAYGREAIRRYGFARGAAKTVVRIARCGPWTPMGTVDSP